MKYTGWILTCVLFISDLFHVEGTTPTYCCMYDLKALQRPLVSRWSIKEPLGIIIMALSRYGTFPLLLLYMVLCSSISSRRSLKSTTQAFKSSPRSCQGRGLTCHSAVTSLYTNHLPFSCGRTQCHPPSVQSQLHSVGDTGPRHDIFQERKEKSLIADTVDLSTKQHVYD